MRPGCAAPLVGTLVVPISFAMPNGELGPPAAELLPPHPTLPSLRVAAAGCRACPLWKRGTQTVFGEGSEHAKAIFVGEEPGDEEDRGGRPFIGPAGKLLDRVLADAGIERAKIYVTNAVKHFKWIPRGKRRIHERPNRAEIDACRPWLDAEIALVRPPLIVCLGATAAKSLLGPDFRVTHRRGQLVPSPLARYVMATVHPSAVLRAPDDEARHAAREQLTADLRGVAALIG